MTQAPAPEHVLKSTYCSCKTSCNTSSCVCQKSQMQCTEVFQCEDCLKIGAIVEEEDDETDHSDNYDENTFLWQSAYFIQ